MANFFSFFFQAEDGIRNLVRSRGLGDVYKSKSRVGDAANRDMETGPESPSRDPP